MSEADLDNIRPHGPATDSDFREEIDLAGMLRTIWSGRWLLLATTSVCVLAASAYVFLATQWFRAEVLIAVSDDKAARGLAAQFGGLASLAGLNVGGTKSVEPVAVLQSREFTRQFIEQQNLMPVLFAEDWDVATSEWRPRNDGREKDWRDGVEYFNKNVRKVFEDKKTGLITLSIEWKDPDVAAQWANLFVQRANDRLRDAALAEANRNVAYLTDVLASTTITTMQQSVGRLLESEMQKLMLAKGNNEFAFKVIDRAEAPKKRSRPNRLLILELSAAFGALASIMFVLIRAAYLDNARRSRVVE